MKKKQGVAIQYCLDAILFDEVLDSIPKEVKIKKLLFEIGEPLGKVRLEASNKLKSLGVDYIRVPSGKRYIVGKFENISRKEMSDNIRDICLLEGVLRAEVRVRSITLEYSTTRETITTTFIRERKEIRPDKTDQRKKLTVLGMNSYSGSGISALLQVLSLNKYECQVETVTTRRVMCRKK